MNFRVFEGFKRYFMFYGKGGLSNFAAHPRYKEANNWSAI